VVTPTALRWSFFIAVALIAAALSDALVEGISNTGIFGSAYFDGNQQNVVPTLIAGILLSLEIAAFRALDAYRQAMRCRRGCLPEIASAISGRSSAHYVPSVLVLQFAALFAMESGEQLFAGGRLLGGTAWLGGPVLFSLSMHALIGAACTFILGWIVRKIAATCTSLLRIAIEFVLVAAKRGIGAAFVRCSYEAPYLPVQSAHVRHIGGRAPPALSTPA
jgi:hypothetical protein